ncbi:hypothetical protein PCANC_17257 [Puccinia coronata f. sp. avenae]|uniref:Uncharacterized protein n=1 Tax=Puccinia coronata f. sp. avenae TaxID=200324 RepID=A0A2N5UY19_9BASI|nr:hypothetical protein PCASD_13845 [Puccinia coronata f. sp. avenae]PLW32592.1 hypothetical protein PCANC_17257 [Puccinia coronata f. sp. avenae]PLW42587.1 hypothetical protein PCASD_05269 [Puccinia coronata f. sp. avenae]
MNQEVDLAPFTHDTQKRGYVRHRPVPPIVIKTEKGMKTSELRMTSSSGDSVYAAAFGNSKRRVAEDSPDELDYDLRKPQKRN